MNYKKIYDDIIEKAKTRYSKSKYLTYKENKDIYLENHHIVPKYAGGDNSKENMVLLTGKEHYIVHHILYRIEPKNTKAVYAFHRMIHPSDFMKFRFSPKLTASEYEKIRKQHAILVSKTCRGRICSEYSKIIASFTHKGKTITDIHKKQIGNASKNKSDAHKKSLAISNRFRNNKRCNIDGILYESSEIAYTKIKNKTYFKSISSFRRDLNNPRYGNMYYV